VNKALKTFYFYNINICCLFFEGVNRFLRHQQAQDDDGGRVCDGGREADGVTQPLLAKDRRCAQ